MNKLLGALLLSVLVNATAVAAITIGKEAPGFTLPSSHGETVSLADFRGKTVVLEWTNHLCPYVQKHYSSDNMQLLQREYTADGVIWLSIISSAPGKQGYVDADMANQLTSERDAAPTHVLFDTSGEVGKQYSAKTTPHMYIIDAQGTLRYAGGIDSIKSADPADIGRATNYVDEALSAMAAGEPIQDTLTPPYGCSIKYAG